MEQTRNTFSILVGKYLVLCVRFEILAAVKISIVVFWVVTPCGLIGGYQHFGGMYRLHPEELTRHLVLWLPMRT
jgi:hypothetical protein